jgi:uncharacterized protein YciI
MTDYFAVRTTHGPGWDSLRSLREQLLWDEHAAFMDALTAEGFVVLGGVLGDIQGALLIIEAEDEGAVRTRLAQDPWTRSGHLTIASIDTWNILLNAHRL